MLEANNHEKNCFVTLTYSDDNLPAGHSLAPDHVQNWLKRLRKTHEPEKLRYYLVGEYGDDTNRPHYHVALFNYPPCRFGQSQYSKSRKSCCPSCDNILTTWGLGQIYLGTLETHSAQYVCGYVTKKMTAKDDPRLEGRHPEFCRMSLRPGIGANALHEIASTLMQFNLDTSQADVPSVLRHGSRELPLGRYLRRKLRTLIGKAPNAPAHEIEKLQKKMLPLLARARVDKENFTLKKQILEAGRQPALNQAARSKIFKQGKKL